MILQVTLKVFELASAAGFKCNIDPALVSAIAGMHTGKQKTLTIKGTFIVIVTWLNLDKRASFYDLMWSADNKTIDEEYKLSCLLLVYIAVSLPALATDPNSLYNREHGGAHSFIHLFI